MRGNWRNEKEFSGMLLAKSCHYIDLIRYYVGSACVKVSSFGNLKHFRKKNQPKGAAARCLDCPAAVASKCPYSAVRFYLGRVRAGVLGWPTNVLSPEVSEKTIKKALREGPYGRCVYACDNDVVDHRVVNMEFAGGQTAVHTMTAFTPDGDPGWSTRLFGTRGLLCGSFDRIECFDFLTNTSTIYKPALFTSLLTSQAVGGHGGGDGGFMSQFVEAVASRDQSKLITGPDETLDSHRIVFAAEKSRKTGRVVTLD